MRLSQLARRPRHHVGAVPEPGRQSPGIPDRKPHSITSGAASPTPAGRTVTWWQPTASRRRCSCAVIFRHAAELASYGGCALSARCGRTSNDNAVPRQGGGGAPCRLLSPRRGGGSVRLMRRSAAGPWRPARPGSARFKEFRAPQRQANRSCPRQRRAGPRSSPASSVASGASRSWPRI